MSDITSRPDLMKEAFNLLQVSGKIPASSIPTALRAAGLNPSEEKINEIMSLAVDLDMPAYEQLVAKHDATSADDTVELLREAFRVFDKDLSGKIAVSELRHVLNQTGYECSEAEFTKLTSKHTENGFILYEKFAEAMLAPFVDLGNPEEMI